jgi:hypothetical protein
MFLLCSSQVLTAIAPLAMGELVPVIRLTCHAVAVAVHMFAVSGVAASERGFAGGADFVAAAIVDGLLDRIPRRDFVLGHGREVVDGKEGQDDQRSSGFEE